MTTYPQVSAAARAVSARVSVDTLSAGPRRPQPTVSTEEYEARKATIAPYSQASFSGQPTMEFSGPTTQSSEGGLKPLVQNSPLAAAANSPIASAPSISWQGIQLANQVSPASPDLAVGPTDAVMVVNSSIAAFTKAGALKTQVDLYTWFGPLLTTLCPNGGCLIFDPWIRYDQLHGRYLFLAASHDGNFQNSYLLLSVSNGASFDSGWKIWALNARLEGGTLTTSWADSWRLGFDGVAVYLSGNMFDPFNPIKGFTGAKIRVIKKSELYNPATTALHYADLANLNNFNGTLADSIVPAQQRGKPAAVNAAMLVNSTTLSKDLSGNPTPANFLTVWQINTPTAMFPTATRCTIGSALPYVYPARAPQLGAFTHIDAGDSRTLKAIYRNGFLYTARDSGYSDAPTTITFDLVNTSSMTLVSQGRLMNTNSFYPAFDVPASTPPGTPFPTSNVIAGTTTAPDGSLTYPSISMLKAGESPYVLYPDPEPWGDYFGGALDPITGGLWTSGEYGKTTSLWGTWVGYFPWTPTGTFADVPPSSFFADYINVLATWQVTLGCTATQYCPGDPVTRGQLAAFIIRSMYGNSFTYTTTPYFTDVPPSDQFFSYIQKLRDLGITLGCAPTMFCPGNGVTRGEAAVLLIRGKMSAVFGDNFSFPTTQIFTDVPPNSQQYPFVQKLSELGITSGCAPGLFCVNNTLTRQEMAVFIVRTFLN